MNFKLPLQQTARIAAIGAQWTHVSEIIVYGLMAPQTEDLSLGMNFGNHEPECSSTPLLHLCSWTDPRVVTEIFFLRLFHLRSLSAQCYYINIPSRCILVC
jgi:hypothetical protein